MGSSKGGEMQFWTREEYLAFSQEMMDRPLDFLAFEILYWAGIREGELLALMPSDFDFRKRKLNITRSFQRIDREDVITPPKTYKGTRTIALPEFLVEEVAEHLRIFECAPDERMFKFSKSHLSNMMTRGSKAAHVKRIRIHDLRHSHVSLLIEREFSALAIAERMGHEAIDITLRYAHLFPNKQDDMARALQGQKGEWQ